jgi:hypothetical protein
MSWEYSDTEYLKLFRKLVRWEWYTDINTKTLFIHCLIRANWKGGTWRGIKYKRGQFIATIDSLSKECGLSRQNTRTALKHLLSTNELTISRHGKKLLFTVLNYNQYQGNQPQIQPLTNQSLTSNQPVTNHRYKNNKNNKEDEENLYMASLDENSEDDQLDAEYEEDEDEYAGYVIPQKDEDGNWIDPEW